MTKINPAAPKTNKGRWRSHVRNFYEDYQDGPKKYWHGPDAAIRMVKAGGQMRGIRKGVLGFICEEWCKNDCSGPIDLVGYSRGGYGVMQVADALKNNGCTCDGKTYKNVKVRFLGMYDPVDSAIGFGTTDEVPSNVKNAYAAFAKAGVYADQNGDEKFALRSRDLFNRKGYNAENPSATNLTVAKYVATHGALGGAPWDGDRVSGHTEWNDIRMAELVDRNMRDNAQAAGVGVPDIGDYGYSVGGGRY